MLIIKILGILDILTALIFWLFGMFEIMPKLLIVILAFYLLIKGLFFLISADIASILDIASAVIIFLSLNFPIPKIIVIITALFLMQKGVFSLFR